MSAHIIGRPNDDLLDIMLARGADPEQVFIRGSEHGREEGDEAPAFAVSDRRPRGGRSTTVAAS